MVFSFFSLKFGENLDLCDHFYAFFVDILFLFWVLMAKPMMFLATTCMINHLTLVCSHGLCWCNHIIIIIFPFGWLICPPWLVFFSFCTFGESSNSYYHDNSCFTILRAYPSLHCTYKTDSFNWRMPVCMNGTR